MFITFEGLDFCGKSTQVKLLADKLTAAGKKVKLLREPGGTRISEKIRDLLLDKKNSEMTIESELLLFSASRAQLVREVILPSLRKDYFVISDRFHDSSIAYQGYGRGINVQSVEAIQNFAINGAVPDITFFIDIPVEEMLLRKNKIADSQLDRIEVSVSEFYERVRNGYLEMSNRKKRFVVINGTEKIDIISQNIFSIISTKQKEKE